MDKFETRRQRLQQLIDKECQGNKAECARRINRHQSYVSRLLYPAGKPGKKNLSDDLIDAIEAGFNLPRGWLDGSEEEAEITAITKLWPSLSPYKKLAIICLIEAIAKAGEPEDTAPPGATTPDDSPAKKNNLALAPDYPASTNVFSLPGLPERRRENRRQSATHSNLRRFYDRRQGR